MPLFQIGVVIGIPCLLYITTDVVPRGDCQVEDVETLLCHHVYLPCNATSGETYLPLLPECQHVEEACGEWWNKTRGSPQGYLLPNCSILQGKVSLGRGF